MATRTRTRSAAPVCPPGPSELDIVIVTMGRLLGGRVRALSKAAELVIRKHAEWIFTYNPPACGYILYGAVLLANGQCVPAASSAGPGSQSVSGIFHACMQAERYTRDQVVIPAHNTIMLRAKGDVSVATARQYSRLVKQTI